MGVFLTLVVFVFPVIFIFGALLGFEAGVGIFFGIALFIGLICLAFVSGGATSVAIDAATSTNNNVNNGATANSSENTKIISYNNAVFKLRFGSSYLINRNGFVFNFDENFVVVQRELYQKYRTLQIPFDCLYSVSFRENVMDLIYLNVNEKGEVVKEKLTFYFYKNNNEKDKQDIASMYNLFQFVIKNKSQICNCKTRKEKMQIAGLSSLIKHRPIV